MRQHRLSICVADRVTEPARPGGRARQFGRAACRRVPSVSPAPQVESIKPGGSAGSATVQRLAAGTQNGGTSTARLGSGSDPKFAALKADVRDKQHRLGGPQAKAEAACRLIPHESVLTFVSPLG